MHVPPPFSSCSPFAACARSTSQLRYEMNRNMTQTNTTLEQKLGYIIDVLEGRARDNDPAFAVCPRVNACRRRSVFCHWPDCPLMIAWSGR